MKRADGLVLALGEVPALLLAGKRAPLTMPALSPEMMEPLLNDALGHDERTALRDAGLVDTTYRSSAYGALTIRAQSSGQQVVLTLRRSAPSRRSRCGNRSGTVW